jgi:RND family efflux transporter MFP subunit
MVMKPEPFTATIQLTGTVKAVDDVLLSPEEGGVVKEWKIDKGQQVSKGTVLAVLNDDVLKATYESALAQYNSSELTFQKQQNVFAEQAVSEWQLKTAEYGRDAARAQADIMHARLERTRLRSPISGVLDDRLVDMGEMASPGLPIARVVNMDRMKIAISVPERYAGMLRRGTNVTFTVTAYPGEVFRGKIQFIGSAISPDNRTFPVEAELSNPGRRLKPDMIARVKIIQESKSSSLLVSEEIVQRVDNERLIVYVEQSGRAKERLVQIGSREGDRVEILAGLAVGDRVIISGYQNVIDGQPVQVTE